MLLSNGPGRSVPADQRGQSEEQTTSIQGWEGLTVQPFSSSRLSEPRHRRLLRIVSILLLFRLTFALVPLSIILSFIDGQFLLDSIASSSERKRRRYEQLCLPVPCRYSIWTPWDILKHK